MDHERVHNTNERFPMWIGQKWLLQLQRRKHVGLFKSGRFSNVSKLSGGEIFCKMDPDNIVCKSFILQGGDKGKKVCPYGVPIGEIVQVQDLQSFWTTCLGI